MIVILIDKSFIFLYCLVSVFTLRFYLGITISSAAMMSFWLRFLLVCLDWNFQNVNFGSVTCSSWHLPPWWVWLWGPAGCVLSSPRGRLRIPVVGFALKDQWDTAFPILPNLTHGDRRFRTTQLPSSYLLYPECSSAFCFILPHICNCTAGAERYFFVLALL